MKNYSACNWWPGNLRKHESRLCFSTRFCILNSIRIRRLSAFLEADVEDGIPLSLCALKRLKFLLNEQELIIHSVFSPKIEQLKLLRISSSRRPSSAIRYCDTCAAQGFHSYLHEIPWISSCPFHLTELKLHFGNRDSKFGVVDTGHPHDLALLLVGRAMPNLARTSAGAQATAARQVGENIRGLVDTSLTRTRTTSCRTNMGEVAGRR